MFLEGPPRIGKSTLIRNNLVPYTSDVAGLMVQRLYEDDKICGYRACLAEGSLPDLEAEYTENLPVVFLYHGKSHPQILDQVICSVLALCEKSSYRLILLDEIGGLELSSTVFRESLKRMLSLGKPCIGVVKSRENLMNTLRKLNLPDKVLDESRLLHSRIKAGGEVFPVNGDNLEKADQSVKLFLEKFFENKV